MTWTVKFLCACLAALMMTASLSALPMAAEEVEDNVEDGEAEVSVFDECDGLVAEIADELGTKKTLLAGQSNRLNTIKTRLEELRADTDVEEDALEAELATHARNLKSILSAVEDGSGIHPYFGRIEEYLGEVEAAVAVVTISNEMRRELADIRLALIDIKNDTSVISHAEASVLLKPLYDRLEVLENRLIDCANGKHEYADYKPQGDGTMIGSCKHGCGATETRDDPDYVPPVPPDPKEEIPLAIWIGVSAIVICAAVLVVIHSGSRKKKTLRNKK